MKSVFHFILLTALLVTVAGCFSGLLDVDKDPETKEEFIGKIENAIGTIEKRGVLVINADADSVAHRPSNFYQPSNLAEEFYQEGLRVIFSGLLEKIEPNIRYYGSPIKLTEIHRLDQQ
jgi:hypothetical protein